MGTTKIRFARDGDVLVVTVLGDVTLDCVLRIRAAISDEWATGPPVRAAVVDLRDVRLLLADREWDLAIAASLRWTFHPARPEATVVSPDERPLFQDFAGRLTRHGIVSGVFTDFASAMVWAGSRPEAVRQRQLTL